MGRAENLMHGSHHIQSPRVLVHRQTESTTMSAGDLHQGETGIPHSHQSFEVPLFMLK